jgi:hypothetical protein
MGEEDIAAQTLQWMELVQSREELESIHERASQQYGNEFVLF